MGVPKTAQSWYNAYCKFLNDECYALATRNARLLRWSQSKIFHMENDERYKAFWQLYEAGKLGCDPRVTYTDREMQQIIDGVIDMRDCRGLKYSLDEMLMELEDLRMRYKQAKYD